MNEVIERAGAKISQSTGCNSFPCLKCETAEGCVSIARVAIDALHNPPEDVLRALNAWGVCAGDYEKGWNAAIDKILSG